MTDAESGGFAEFRRGLLEPNLVSVVTLVLVCAGLVLGVALSVDESFASSPRFQYLAADRGAHTMAVTSRILRLGREPPRERQVLVMGTSAVRNSVDPARLQERLRQELGEDVTVHGLSTGAQPLALARGMIERVSSSTRGVVVLGVGMRQMAAGDDDVADLGRSPRLGLRSDALDAAIEAAGGEPPSRIGVYVWDNRNFIAPRLLADALPNLIRGPREPVAMPHAGKGPFPRQHYDGRLNAMAEHVAGYQRNVGRNVAELERLVADVARHPALDLVLLESVVNPEFVRRHALEAQRADLSARLEAVAERFDVRLLQLDDAARLRAGDFRDAAHLRSLDAIRRYTDLLADHLARHFAERGE